MAAWHNSGRRHYIFTYVNQGTGESTSHAVHVMLAELVARLARRVVWHTIDVGYEGLIDSSAFHSTSIGTYKRSRIVVLGMSWKISYLSEDVKSTLFLRLPRWPETTLWCTECCIQRGRRVFVEIVVDAYMIH